MEPRFENLWQGWHDDLIRFARYDVPKLIAIILLAFILVRMLTIITRKMVDLSKRAAVHPSIRAQQVSTLVGVVRSAGIFVILFVAVMQALQVFNINIAPLLASAGIAGLAIGFGAQTLVKDVINGFFILAENQFEVGDVIKAAGVQGIVEEITMRRTILRDTDGTVHTVPNSNIQIVSNTTRDWSQVTLHVAVDYSEESERVMQILREAAMELYNDVEFRDDIVAEPDVPGIERVSGHEVDYLVIVKVRPRRQDRVSRELRRRIKACLEKNQIKAAGPVQVYIGQMPKSGT
jgi:small conductance mechanosensitive channel